MTKLRPSISVRCIARALTHNVTFPLVPRIVEHLKQLERGFEFSLQGLGIVGRQDCGLARDQIDLWDLRLLIVFLLDCRMQRAYCSSGNECLGMEAT